MLTSTSDPDKFDRWYFGQDDCPVDQHLVVEAPPKHNIVVLYRDGSLKYKACHADAGHMVRERVYVECEQNPDIVKYWPLGTTWEEIYIALDMRFKVVVTGTELWGKLQASRKFAGEKAGKLW